MGKKRLFILFTVFALALLVVVPGIAGISGSGASGVQIQNLSTSSPVNVVVELWNQDGTAAIPVSATGGDTINASAAKNYYLPTLPGVPDGAYAMAVSAGGPIAAIARTDWSATGGAALYSSVAPGTDVIIPLVTSAFAGQTSQFSIQNTNTAAEVTDVVITLYGRGLAAPVITLPPETIAAGTSKTYSMADAMWGSLPNTGVDLGVLTGFVGSVQITSATDLVVQSFIDIAGTPAVGGFTGVPTASAADTLYCPLIRANYFGDTGISIVNPNATAVDVDITFIGDAGSPHTGTFNQSMNVPANSSVIAFQGPGGNSRSAPTNLPGGTQSSVNPVLTNDGFYGVAQLSATGNIQAVVNDTKFGAGWAIDAQSTYNCASPADAGTSFALPLVRRFHLASTRLTTGIQIQNLSASPVTASLDLFNWDGTSQSASNPPDINIPANGSGNFWNGTLTGLPTVPASLGGSGWFGSAVITITGGEAVILVDDQGYGSTAVDSANYNGFPLQ